MLSMQSSGHVKVPKNTILFATTSVLILGVRALYRGGEESRGGDVGTYTMIMMSMWILSVLDSRHQIPCYDIM